MEPQLIQIEIEKYLEEIYTYIDIKFEEQEYIIKKMIEIKKPIKNTIDTSILKQQNNFILEKNKMGIKAIVLILLNFLIILFFIYLLYYYNLYELNFKIEEIIYENKEIINYFSKRILKFLLFLIISLFNIYFSFKNSLFPPSTPPGDKDLSIETNYNELFSIFNEIFENQSIISDILDNISEEINYNDAYNILDQLNSEYNKREEMLNKIESDTEKILEELDSNISIFEEPINNISDFYNKKELGRSLIISSSILGSSIILYSLIPTILEILLK